MMMRLDLQKRSLPLTLGTLTLEIGDWQLRTEAAVLRRVLCDGSVLQTVCGDYPCTLTVSGQTLPDAGSALLAGLTAEMTAHTEFDFDFADMSFSGMQLTAVEGKLRRSEGVTAFTLTLTGGLCS